MTRGGYNGVSTFVGPRSPLLGYKTPDNAELARIQLENERLHAESLRKLKTNVARIAKERVKRRVVLDQPSSLSQPVAPQRFHKEIDALAAVRAAAEPVHICSEVARFSECDDTLAISIAKEAQNFLERPR